MSLEPHRRRHSQALGPCCDLSAILENRGGCGPDRWSACDQGGPQDGSARDAAARPSSTAVNCQLSLGLLHRRHSHRRHSGRVSEAGGVVLYDRLEVALVNFALMHLSLKCASPTVRERPFQLGLCSFKKRRLKSEVLPALPTPNELGMFIDESDRKEIANGRNEKV